MNESKRTNVSLTDIEHHRELPFMWKGFKKVISANMVPLWLISVRVE